MVSSTWVANTPLIGTFMSFMRFFVYLISSIYCSTYYIVRICYKKSLHKGSNLSFRFRIPKSLCIEVQDEYMWVSEGIVFGPYIFYFNSVRKKNKNWKENEVRSNKNSNFIPPKYHSATVYLIN